MRASPSPSTKTVIIKLVIEDQGRRKATGAPGQRTEPALHNFFWDHTLFRWETLFFKHKRPVIDTPYKFTELVVLGRR